MNSKTRNALLAGCVLVVATTVARAQPVDPIGQILSATQAAEAQRQTPAASAGATDQANLTRALNSAKRGDISGARSAMAAIDNRIAKKAALWALVDANADSLGFFEVDNARRELAGFPRPGRRQQAAERLLETSGKSPREIVEWFGGQAPQTAEGALALATAYRALNRQPEAAELIRRWWREESFEAGVQQKILLRFPDVLRAEDHVRRADILLYGAQGPATRDLIALLPPDQQLLAYARISLRNDSTVNYDALTPAQQTQPGVAFERAAYLRRRGLDTVALGQLPSFPKEISTSEAASRMWSERYRLTLAAIRGGDWRNAYAASANSGLTQGADAADAEFYAGWIALSRLNDPVAAGKHFANLERIGSSPITRGRAYYWQGRAADARKDKAAAHAFYEKGAEHLTTFYGQLSAEKLGRPLVLTPDPNPTAADRARFESQDVVKAMRLLADSGQRDLFRIFAAHVDDAVETTTEAALLVDMLRAYGDQDSAMRAVRASAQRGLILTGRGYPLLTPPQVTGGPEPALVLGVTRQESGFDPYARSSADARGMMQLLPATAQIVARRMGVSYSAARLNEPDYNMQLGSSYLGEMVNRFSGSYIMAAAGYNAGPGRPPQWVSMCGDPRGATDPLDYIECIPFSETRNYVMRVLENMTVYRARLAGGTAPITLSADLRRGGWSAPPSLPTTSASGP